MNAGVNVVNIPVDKIVIPENYIPVHHKKNTCEAIRITGIIAPIFVKPEEDKYVLVDGYERIMCAKELGIKELPAVIVQGNESLLSFALNMVRGRYAGVDELAYVWQFLQKYDRSLVAKILGRSYETIRKYQDVYERMLALGLSKEDWQKLRVDGIGVKRLIQCVYDAIDAKDFMNCVYEGRKRHRPKGITGEAIRKAIELEKNQEMKTAVDIVEAYGPEAVEKAIQLYEMVRKEICPKLKELKEKVDTMTYNILAQYC